MPRDGLLRFAPRNDVDGPAYTLAFSRRVAPEVCYSNFPPSNQRAQGMPDARCTRGLMCDCAKESLHMSIQGSGEHPTFPAQWLYGLWRDLPGETASIATVAPGQR